MRSPVTVLLIAATLPLAACKIEKTVLRDPSQSDTSAFTNDASFNPDQMVNADWDSKVIPLLRGKAGPYKDVSQAITQDADQAGEKYGYREKQPGSVWTYAAKLDGTVTASNTESRAATLDVKTTDGSTVQVQIGPVVRGTAIRDMLAFRPFGSFKNQIDYAQFGKALNAKANATALSKMPRKDLVGKPVSLLGVFQAASGGTPPLMTPIEITVGTAP